MDKIPTAKEFLAKITMRPLKSMDNENLNICPSDAIEAMIKFANLHVNAALKNAAENAETKSVVYSDERVIDPTTILWAYPESNIQ